MTDYLNVYPVNFISLEFASFEFALHNGKDIVVRDVGIFVEPCVVQMDVFRGVYVKEHLVAAARPPGINPEVRQPGQYVVDRSHGN